MEKAYWLQRQQDSGDRARSSTSAQARLIHLDLAGRYGIEAANVVLETEFEPAEASPERQATAGQPLDEPVRSAEVGPAQYPPRVPS